MQLDRKSFATCKQWLFDFIGCASDIQATALAVGFWYIWEARNESRNEDVKQTPCRTGGKVVGYVDLIRTRLFKPVSKQRCEPSSDRWTPPPQGTVLVKSDALQGYRLYGIRCGNSKSSWCFSSCLPGSSELDL
jgi:hypothetical protein